MPPCQRSSISAREAFQRHRAVKIGEVNTACCKTCADGGWVKKSENVGQRKAVLVGQGNIDAVVGGRRLQLKIEGTAKTFAEGQSPGFVDPPAEWCVDDKLHPATFIEEAFRNDGLLCWDRAQAPRAPQ